MLNLPEISGLIAKHGYSKSGLAKEIGISPASFLRHLKRGQLGSEEIEAMIRILHIKDPVPIFFAQKVTHQATDDLYDTA